MRVEVELYRGDARVPERRVGLIALLKAVLADELAGDRGQAAFNLRFQPIEDPEDYPGPPLLKNRQSGYGYLNVMAQVEGRVIYRHPHSVKGLLGPALTALAREIDASEEYWSFRIDAPGMDDAPVRRLPPPVSGAMDVDISRSARLSFGVRPAAEPELPEFDLVESALPPSTEDQRVTVVLAPGIERLLTRELPLSDRVEEGGFLFGKAYRRPEAEERYVVVVEHVLPAEHTGASLMHFTFTGDSFRAMSRALRDRHPGARLVGWYHTHLFPAVGRMGLSGTDIDLHRATFRRPWQVAALINYSEGNRVLRCYARSDATMEASSLWSRDDNSDRYRPAASSLGRQ
ncbi:JAB N-terminal domain-containing protein [Streptomyces sp. NPDC026659]|uniref:JAB N-terminal domain-containing protein n=1 Tax=Streptomyces sp. NPDC026659 TaxID=3155123 RepID=UPI0033FE51F1